MGRPRIAADDLHLILAHFGVRQWCALTGHQCDGCDCTCHDDAAA